jgi:hypothetical protein
MHKSLVSFALLSLFVSPAAAQTAPPAPTPAASASQAAPAPAAKTVKKTVCERVVIEETTGSRLGAAPKRCRTIEVPAPAGGSSGRAPAPKGAERG